MSTNQEVIRDERTVAVENGGSRLACNFLMFALLLDMMYRSWFRHEAAWDMMAMIIVSGAVSWIYRVRQKTLPRGWLKTALLIAFSAGVVSALIAFALAHFRR